MWLLVTQGQAWQLTEEDQTGLWEHADPSLVWMDIGDNPLGIKEGWLADLVDGEWQFRPWTPPPVSPEEQILINGQTQSYLINQASLMMTPLLMSLQLDMATGDDLELAKEWQQYYKNLKAVDISVQEPSWPQPPEPVGN